MLFAGDAVAQKLGIPHIAEIRDAWPDLIADSQLVHAATRGLLPESVSGFLEQRVLPGVFHGALRRAAHIVVTADGFRSQLLHAGHHDVTVVRNTAVPYRPSKVRRNRSHADDLHVLYVGTVGRSQGLESLVRAVSDVPGVQLTIVGAGAAKRSLERLAAEVVFRSEGAHQRSAVQFLPQTTGEELERLWRWADSGIVSLADIPSFEYTVPSKLYTLMARGVHITGILAGEAAQVVEEAGAGDVVAPGNSAGLRQLLVGLRDGRIPLSPSLQAQEWLAEHAAPEIALQRYLRVIEGVR